MPFHLMRYLATLVSCLTASGLCGEEQMVVNSENAEYNGQLITLNGHVFIEHELGNLRADRIILNPEIHDKKVQAKHLLLQNNVIISIKGGGQLRCSKAEVDFTTLQGIFSGNAEQEFVSYTESFTDNTEKPTTVVLKSRQMAVQIAKEIRGSIIKSVSAEQDVTVSYNDDILATADEAAYQRMAPAENEACPGLISLRAKGDNGVCRVTNHNGDMIAADHLCIDTTQRKMFFAYPKGALYLGEKKTERLDFSGDALTWDEGQNLLTLSEHVAIHQNELGTLTSDRDVQIKQRVLNKKKQLDTIESHGNTTLRYMEPEKQLAHILTCHGKVLVDHKNLVTTMESPRDAQGNVLEGKKVSFHDHMGEIYADKLTIHYAKQENSLKPTALKLEGNVHLLNRTAIDSENKTDFMQYALADTVEYTTQAKEISLSAHTGNRVLFFDRVNNLQVSAPALKIRRDEATQKESIQGIGNVRFSFQKQEIEAIKKQFHLTPE